jgi:hypothetical protein
MIHYKSMPPSSIRIAEKISAIATRIQPKILTSGAFRGQGLLGTIMENSQQYLRVRSYFRILQQRHETENIFCEDNRIIQFIV